MRPPELPEPLPLDPPEPLPEPLPLLLESLPEPLPLLLESLPEPLPLDPPPVSTHDPETSQIAPVAQSASVSQAPLAPLEPLLPAPLVPPPLVTVHPSEHARIEPSGRPVERRAFSSAQDAACMHCARHRLDEHSALDGRPHSVSLMRRASSQELTVCPAPAP